MRRCLPFFMFAVCACAHAQSPDTSPQTEVTVVDEAGDPLLGSISFWSRTLMRTLVPRFGAGMETALAVRTQERIVRAKAEERNIRVLLLKKRALSRGNWRSRTGRAEAKPRRPGQE